MVLKDYLMRDEVVKFTAEPKMEYAGQKDYEVFLTNKRLVLFKNKGFLIKRDKFVSIALRDLDEVSFEEKGLVSKRGVIIMKTKDGTRKMVGNMAETKEVFQTIQNQLSLPSRLLSSVNYEEEPSLIIKETEITKEVVLISCDHCSSLMPQSSLFCNHCGARRKLVH